jgi:hypothetical protein
MISGDPALGASETPQNQSRISIDELFRRIGERDRAWPQRRDTARTVRHLPTVRRCASPMPRPTAWCRRLPGGCGALAEQESIIRGQESEVA